MHDWRLQGQDKYLSGVSLARRRYRTYRRDWDHDHCEFCGAKFSERPGDLKIGYVTLDGYHWICDACYADFSGLFKWKLAQPDGIDIGSPDV